MTQPTIRIGISGPSGAGKTTLASALAERLSIPLLEEGMVPIYKARHAFRTLSESPTASPEERRQALNARIKTYFDWCEARAQAYVRNPSFVADRWELDVFGYWLQGFPRYEIDESTHRLQRLFLDRAQAFDLVVVLPAATFEAPTHNEAGLKRVQNYTTQFLTQTNFTGLLHLIPGTVARYAPIETEPVEKRVDDILGIVRRLQQRAPV